ncbi:MAG: type II toxin-antitoxin system Phd/YefM family antitoxin [Caldilineaceae bacterium]|nr:type II toxin-antitoxin system Phd/YefM family antitoxin [Caldilineaceae bacterium]
MQKTIGVNELQSNLRGVVNEVIGQHTPYILTLRDQPEAALIPYAEFLRFLLWKEADILSEFDTVLSELAEENAVYTVEEIDADVEAAIAETRSIA